MTVISGREAEASQQGHAEIILTSPVSVVSRDTASQRLKGKWRVIKICQFKIMA